MENLNLDEDSINIKNVVLYTSSSSSIKKEFSLSNPIFTEMINFNVQKDDIDYEFIISYKNEKWTIKRNLSEIKNLIKSLQNLKFMFFNENYFNKLVININDKTLNIKEINLNILNFLRYVNYRFDILANVLTRDFFRMDKCSEPEVLSNMIKKNNLEIIHNFKVEESDMSLSDFFYSPELGLLIMGLEDISYFSRLGRFWSLIEYEILGNCFIYQRIFDKENRPYFRKLITKNFDARVSKIELNLEKGKIFVGIDNGAIQIFNITMIDRNFCPPKNPTSTIEDKIIYIAEGNNFKYLNDRVTGLQCYLEFLFISSKENKLLILNVSQTIPEIKFNGSLKKRIIGKGHISDIKIDHHLKKLFVITITDKILIYDIVTFNKFTNSEVSLDIKIEFVNEIESLSNIKNVFIKGISLFVALENKIQIFTLNDLNNNQIDYNVIPLDGSLDELISYSSKFIKLEYTNYISAVSFFTDMKLIILGLSNGTVLAINSRSLEIVFAKKISSFEIKKLVILEENYISIAGDEKGNIYFFKLGL